MSWALHPLQIYDSLHSTVHLSFEFILMHWDLLMMLTAHSSCSNYRIYMRIPSYFIHLSLDFYDLSFGLQSCSWLLIGLLILFEFTLQAWPPTLSSSNGPVLRELLHHTAATSDQWVKSSSLRTNGIQSVGMVTDNWFPAPPPPPPLNHNKYNLFQ